MLVERISSRQNPLIKRFRRIRAGSERRVVFIEGVRLIEDALKAGARFESIAFTSALETTDRGLALLDVLQKVPCRGAHVSDQVMQAIADTESPQGVAALVGKPHFEIDKVFAGDPSLLVIADQLQDPGNIGTIIRTAEGAGAAALLSTRHTVDPFNHKALRASMGSAFRLPIITAVTSEEVARRCRDNKILLLAAVSSPQQTPQLVGDSSARPIRIYSEADLTGRLALVLGSEASGTSTEMAGHADELIHIPMSPGTDSLNVAAAAAVILYEAARQRGFHF